MIYEMTMSDTTEPFPSPVPANPIPGPEPVPSEPNPASPEIPELDPTQVPDVVNDPKA